MDTRRVLVGLAALIALVAGGQNDPATGPIVLESTIISSNLDPAQVADQIMLVSGWEFGEDAEIPDRNAEQFVWIDD